MESTENAVPVQSPSRAKFAWIGAGVVLIAASWAAWRWHHHGVAPAPVVATSKAAPVAAPPVSKPAPAVTVSPDFTAWASALSSNGELLSWLNAGDVARRIAGALLAIDRGENPRPMLRPLALAAPFAVTSKHHRLFISEASYHRYDALAGAIAQLDVQKLADGWKRFHPLFEAAWTEIAPKGSSLDGALAKALETLTAVRVPTRALEVQKVGNAYVFADARLEAMSPAQKQLLRMGPANLKKVEAKLVALETALTPAVHAHR